jgi:hypothetical protein
MAMSEAVVAVMVVLVKGIRLGKVLFVIYVGLLVVLVGVEPHYNNTTLLLLLLLLDRMHVLTLAHSQVLAQPTAEPVKPAAVAMVSVATVLAVLLLLLLLLGLGAVIVTTPLDVLPWMALRGHNADNGYTQTNPDCTTKTGRAVLHEGGQHGHAGGLHEEGHVRLLVVGMRARAAEDGNVGATSEGRQDAGLSLKGQ